MSGTAGGTRAAEAEKRAKALVEVACRVLRSEGWSAFSLERVATAAGVTRRTVYNRFGSKLGLVTAVFEHVFDDGAAWTEAERAADTLDVAIESLTARVLRHWSGDRALLRRLVGLAAAEPEVGRLLFARERRRRTVVTRLVRRIEREAGLAPGLSCDEAIRSALTLTSFPAVDALAGTDGSEAEVARLLGRMLSSLRADFRIAQPVKRALRRG